MNEHPQTEVLLENRTEDTLKATIRWSDNNSYPVHLYLLDKGKKAKRKEFDYRLELRKNKIHSYFTGMYEIIQLPSPLVPRKPVVDTSYKSRNKVLGHFCEIKNGVNVFFNNRPNEKDCTVPMPEEYLHYVAVLMNKAEVPDDKFEIAEATIRNNCISVSQLKSLLAYIEYDLEKLKLVRNAYFQLTDKQNQKQLESSLRFESSVRELNNFFANSESYKILKPGDCQKPSPDEELRSLTDRLSVSANDSERLATLKKLYPSFCYTSAQVKTILYLFIHDREKLEAAKMLYLNTTDKSSFSGVSEVFSYNQSVSDLKEFLEGQSR